MGLFITFEGGEGCGKSYQSKALYSKLLKLGIPVLLTYEPGGTILGNEIRRILKRKHIGKVSSIAELFLFLACRIQLVNEVIQPALKRGLVVICDRFADSTLAYQGYGRGLELRVIDKILPMATQELVPDLTLLLDIPVEDGLARKKSRGTDRFDDEGLVFHNRVRHGYLKLAEQDTDRWRVIDAKLSRVKVSQIIWEQISPLISKL
jgi:dTMP kinase